MINLKNETAHKLRLMGISENITFTLFDSGLIDEYRAKRFLVRNEYESAHPLKGHKGDIKEMLAEKYCVSVETVNLYLKD